MKNNETAEVFTIKELSHIAFHFNGESSLIFPALVLSIVFAGGSSLLSLDVWMTSLMFLFGIVMGIILGPPLSGKYYLYRIGRDYCPAVQIEVINKFKSVFISGESDNSGLDLKELAKKHCKNG